jgi:hypothetical protein
MDNPETQATLGKQDMERRTTKTKHTHNTIQKTDISNTNFTKKPRVNPGAL